MTSPTRETVCANLYFTDASQKSDLLDIRQTNTNLIQILLDWQKGPWDAEYGETIIGITSVRTDHSDDSWLGEHCHAFGRAIDCWPRSYMHAGWWVPHDSPEMVGFLKFLTAHPLVFNIGLGGSVDTPENLAILGAKGFQDDGEDHVHFSCVF